MTNRRTRLCLSRTAPTAVVVVAVVIALVCLLSPPARAGETAAPESPSVALSERKAAEAFQAYSKQDYAAAVALYMDAYAASPSGSILYNVARIYDTKLGDRPLAITFYRRYIADPGSSSELIETANRRLVDLREAELAASKPATDVSAHARGRRGSEASKDARDAASERAERDLQARQGGWTSLRWVGIVMGGVGLATAGVGGGFGLVAMSNATTANQTCDGNACTSQRGVDAAHAARRDATLSTIGIAAGGALLLTGTALFFLGGEKSSAETTHAALHAGLRVDAQTTASGLSLQLSGRW